MKNNCLGTSLAAQWLRLCASTAAGTGLIPGQGTQILQAARQKKKKLPVVCVLYIIINNILPYRNGVGLRFF